MIVCFLYFQVAEELKKESFAKHNLNWVADMDYIVAEMHKCNSKTRLYLTKRMGNSKSTDVGDDFVLPPGKNQARSENVQNTPEVMIVPHPQTHFWKVSCIRNSTWKKISPSLPSSFRWLVDVGSKVCEAPERQILTLVVLIQNEILPQKDS